MDVEIPVCILAGGQSHRFGSPKGLAKIGGASLIEILVARLGSQTSGKIALNAAPDSPYQDGGFALMPDLIAGDIGPLAGLHTAMVWGQSLGAENVVTCPLDVPFVPDNFLAKLTMAGAPAICASQGRLHPISGIWCCDQADDLAQFVSNGGRAARGWAQHCGARTVDFPATDSGQDSFFNINTPDDLAVIAASAPV